MVKRKGKQTLFWTCLLILPLIFASIPIVKSNPDSIAYSDGIMSYSGGSEGSEINFWDLWNASDANGWGVVDKKNNTQFTFSCRLQGNESSWFADTGKQVMFANDILTENGQIWWLLKDGAHLRLGSLIDANKKTTRNGVSIYDGDTNYYCDLLKAEGSAEIKFYSCFISRVYSGIKATFVRIATESVTGHIYNTFFTSMSLMSGFGAKINVEINNIFITDLPSAYGAICAPANAQDVKIMGSLGSAIQDPYAESVTMRNFIIKDCAYIFKAYYSHDNYFIDFDSNTWAFQWVGSSQGEMYRQYSFDLNFTDNAGNPLENVNVTISHYGENAGQDFNGITPSNGSIPTQVFSMGFYNQTGGDTIYDYNPYIITATKEGYQPSVGNFTLNDKTKWNIILQPKREFFPYFGLGVVFALMIGLVFGLAFIYEKRK